MPFFIVYAILTGSINDEQIVWCDNDEILGVRPGTIPIEDKIKIATRIDFWWRFCEPTKPKLFYLGITTVSIA